MLIDELVMPMVVAKQMDLQILALETASEAMGVVEGILSMQLRPEFANAWRVLECEPLK
jgi:hypothetical protein